MDYYFSAILKAVKDYLSSILSETVQYLPYKNGGYSIEAAYVSTENHSGRVSPKQKAAESENRSHSHGQHS